MNSSHRACCVSGTDTHTHTPTPADRSVDRQHKNGKPCEAARMYSSVVNSNFRFKNGKRVTKTASPLRWIPCSTYDLLENEIKNQFTINCRREILFLVLNEEEKKIEEKKRRKEWKKYVFKKMRYYSIHAWR